ncbi:hypothetical protein [Sphaerisporangium sp. NPDC051011]|uniref:hypothetical protein n=1 Tax=Sphaerisporangium sp. NPDC051011 TaxID=3155792 RepID=UPI0033E9191A
MTSVQIIANPAVTIGRAFTGTFAGIAPTSALAFIAAQLLGAATGLGLAALLFDPLVPPPAREVVDAAVPAASFSEQGNSRP